MIKNYTDGFTRIMYEFEAATFCWRSNFKLVSVSGRDDWRLFMYLFVEIDETVVYTETGNRTALINNTFI